MFNNNNNKTLLQQQYEFLKHHTLIRPLSGACGFSCDPSSALCRRRPNHASDTLWCCHTPFYITHSIQFSIFPHPTTACIWGGRGWTDLLTMSRLENMVPEGGWTLDQVIQRRQLHMQRPTQQTGISFHLFDNATGALAGTTVCLHRSTRRGILLNQFWILFWKKKCRFLWSAQCIFGEQECWDGNYLASSLLEEGSCHGSTPANLDIRLWRSQAAQSHILYWGEQWQDEGLLPPLWNWVGECGQGVCLLRKANTPLHKHLHLCTVRQRLAPSKSQHAE